MKISTKDFGGYLRKILRDIYINFWRFVLKIPRDFKETSVNVDLVGQEFEVFTRKKLKVVQN